MQGFSTKSIALTALMVLATTLFGCDGGGSKKSSSSSSGGTSTSSSSSSGFVLQNVQVHFPPNVSNTDLSTITVRGSVTDQTDVVAINVNGTAVDSTNGLAQWSIDVPLSPGANSFPVTYQNGAGETVDVTTLSVNSEPTLISPKQFVYDQVDNRFLILDGAQNALIAADPATGTRTIVSPVAEADALLSNTRRMVLDSANREALIYQNDDEDFIRVNLTDGTQTVAEKAELEGIEFTQELSAIAYESNGRFVVTGVETAYIDSEGNRADEDTGTERLRSIVYWYTPSTGATSILSSFDMPNTEDDVDIGIVGDIATNANSAFVYVLDSSLDSRGNVQYQLIKVSKTDGSRTQVIPALDEDGEKLENSYTLVQPSFIWLTGNDETIWVMDNSMLLSIDLSNAQAVLVSGAGIPEDGDYSLFSVSDFEVNSDGSAAFAISDARDHLLHIDTATGTRTRITGMGAPNTDNLQNFSVPSSISIDETNSLVYVTDQLLGAIFRVNLLTGEKTRVAIRKDENEDGLNDTFLNFPVASVLLGTENLYTLDNINQLEGYSPTSAAPKLNLYNTESEEISRLLAFNNRYFTFYDFIYVAERNTFYTAESYALRTKPYFIRQISLESLSNSELSAYHIPDDKQQFGELRAIAWDPTQQRLLAADAGKNAIMTVDINTGARAILSGPSLPATSSFEFQQPSSITMDAANNRALVVDTSLRSIVAVDLTTGDREIIATHSLLSSTRDIKLFEALGYALLINDLTDTLIAFDFTTGQWLTLAR